MEDSHIHLFIFCLWLPSTQEMSLHMDTTRVNTKIRLIIFLATKDEEILYSQQKKKKKETRPGADCGSDHETPYCKTQAQIEESGENH